MIAYRSEAAAIADVDLALQCETAERHATRPVKSEQTMRQLILSILQLVDPTTIPVIKNGAKN